MKYHRVYTYNPDTGEIRREGIKRPLGKRHPEGYLKTSHLGKKCFNHRLAWFLFYGVWPDKQVDHINGKRDDNRICNLRLADNCENQWNRKISKNNKSGFKGVFFGKREQKWSASIRVRNKVHRLGYFDSVEKAANAYKQAAIRFHGEFANYGQPA